MDLNQIKQRFGIIGNDPELDRALEIARQVAPTNLSVLVTGESLLNAFDKLEVMEYSAKAILNTAGLGDIVKISDEEVSELRSSFGF